MPRMWMVLPETLCDKHLRGEHHEIHVFVGRIKKQMKMEGYIKNGHCQPSMLLLRHHELADEMTRRKWQHKSPLTHADAKAIYLFHSSLSRGEQYMSIDVTESYRELAARCGDCRKRITNCPELSERFKRQIFHGAP